MATKKQPPGVGGPGDGPVRRPRLDRETLEANLAAIETQRIEAKGQLDRERLTRVTSDLIETITSPEFIECMRVARKEADAGAGMDVASELLSINALRRAGVDIPNDFRMTLGSFTARAIPSQLRKDRIFRGDHQKVQPFVTQGEIDHLAPREFYLVVGVR